MSLESKVVFELCSKAVKKELEHKFGTGRLCTAPSNVMAMVAVALMQLSLRYFAETKAPKLVVYELFAKLMGLEHRAKAEERKGKLVLLPPEPSLSVVKGGE